VSKFVSKFPARYELHNNNNVRLSNFCASGKSKFDVIQKRTKRKLNRTTRSTTFCAVWKDNAQYYLQTHRFRVCDCSRFWCPGGKRCLISTSQNIDITRWSNYQIQNVLPVSHSPHSLKLKSKLDIIPIKSHKTIDYFLFYKNVPLFEISQLFNFVRNTKKNLDWGNMRPVIVVALCGVQPHSL